MIHAFELIFHNKENNLLIVCFFKLQERDEARKVKQDEERRKRKVTKKKTFLRLFLLKAIKVIKIWRDFSIVDLTLFFFVWSRWRKKISDRS